MPDDVVVGFRAEGIPQAAAQVEALTRMIERLNTGQASSSGGSLPSGAPGIAPRLSNGMDAYNVSPGTSQPPPIAASSVLPTPFAFSPNPVAPGAFAPSPLGATAGHSNQTQSWQGSSAVSPTIVASTVNLISGGGGSGVPPNGTGGGASGGVPPGGIPPGGPPSPFQGWNPFGGQGGGGPQNVGQLLKLLTKGGSLTGLLHNIPLPSMQPGLFNLPGGGRFGFGPLANMPLLPTALAVAAGFEAYGQWANYRLGSMSPQYQVDTQIMARQASGQFINPIASANMRRNAEIDRILNTHAGDTGFKGFIESSIYNVASSLPLGIGSAVKANWAQDVELPASRQKALNDATSDAATRLRSYYATIGDPRANTVMKDTLTGRLKLSELQDTQVPMAVSQSFLGLGTRVSAAQFGNRAGFKFRQSGGYDPNDVVSSQSSIASYLMNPNIPGQFDKGQSGHFSMSALVDQAVQSGDRGSLLNWLKGGDISSTEFNAANIRLQSLSATGSLLSATRSRVGTGQSFASNLLYSGASSGSVFNQNMNVTGTISSEQPYLEAQFDAAIKSGDRTSIANARQALEQNRADVIGQTRSAYDLKYAFTRSGIGVVAAGSHATSTQAGLYGGVMDINLGEIGQAEVTRGQKNLVTQQIREAQASGRSTPEINELKAQEIELQRQLNQQLEMAKRNYLDMNVTVAHLGESITNTASQIQMSFFGVGGSAAGGLITSNVGSAKTSWSAAQKKVDYYSNLPADNQQRLNAESELQQAKSNYMGQLESYSSAPMPVNLQRQEMAGQFQLGLITRTYAGYGDVRGTVQNLMGNVGQQLHELGGLRQQALDQINKDSTLSATDKQNARDVVNRDFEQRRYGLGNQAIGLQQQLESGWQDRLISSVVGMPGRGAFVASQFTQREAAAFLQTIGPQFGFAGTNGADARDFYRSRGPRIANTLIGNISRPQGFNETAVAMGMGGFTSDGSGPVPSQAGLGVLAPGYKTGAIDDKVLTIVVITKDAAGNVTGKQSSRGTLHDLGNGALTVIQSPHASGVSRQ